ncbi:hypothetical protein BJ684DRAFT_16710 [Piptocephalis cylindrospora]|uniref:4Fe-4S ferredoxin-type domain-containing protein n=1 Tax=Piptocephalis cylindrospora TaxID=1907219 RepID=A0A4P9Y2C9_9FUNG|nr:hypothetical protein BJ684DRAFT_16710 [Piptocephalis cylindrospora]|eukprot:RKP12844.1 hypothetical protein BJ684DRAFT_16710 [Piptocephalis cylindrospora]
MKLFTTLATITLLIAALSAAPERELECGQCIKGQKTCGYKCSPGEPCPLIAIIKQCDEDDAPCPTPSGGDIPPPPIQTHWDCGPCEENQRTCKSICPADIACTPITKTEACVAPHPRVQQRPSREDVHTHTHIQLSDDAPILKCALSVSYKGYYSSPPQPLLIHRILSSVLAMPPKGKKKILGLSRPASNPPPPTPTPSIPATLVGESTQDRSRSQENSPFSGRLPAPFSSIPASTTTTTTTTTEADSNSPTSHTEPPCPDRGGQRPKRKLKPLRRKVSGGGVTHVPRLGPMIKRPLPSAASSFSSTSNNPQGPNIRFSVYTRNTAPSRFPKALTCLTPPRSKGLASRFNMWDEAIPSPTHYTQTNPPPPPSLSLSPIQGTPMTSRIASNPTSPEPSSQPQTPTRNHGSSQALHSTPMIGDVYGFAEAERRVQVMREDPIPRRIFSQRFSDQHDRPGVEDSPLDVSDEGDLSGLDTPIDHAILLEEGHDEHKHESGEREKASPPSMPSLLLSDSPKGASLFHNSESTHQGMENTTSRPSRSPSPSPPSMKRRGLRPRRNPTKDAKNIISSYVPPQRTYRSKGKTSLSKNPHDPIHDPYTTEVSIEVT